jgi:hypothetical protein
VLQEQLRRRSDELGERGKRIEGQETKLEEFRTDLETRERALAEMHQQLEALARDLQARRDELDRRAQEVQAAGAEQDESVQRLAAQVQALASARQAWETQRQTETEELARQRRELEQAREQVREQVRVVPELETRIEMGLDRMKLAREQLREHLAELHAFARQGREELQTARGRIESETEGLRQREQVLADTRDSHRLAVAAFRQQLIEWQGHVRDMRLALERGEQRLERRQADLELQAREVADTSARLAVQAEELQVQEQRVAEQRGEMHRHLNDMREWYRRKLRELAGVDVPEQDGVDPVVMPLPARPDAPSGTGSAENAGEPGEGVLPITGEIDPADRRLGELLRSLELVDADTMTALWVQARRQRRSLRQLLLAGGYLTLYQMALIEAGNVDALMLGPLRVIDRLQITLQETVYRVFDPRRNLEALLRHLSESEMEDAVRPDEFRQRFAAAATVQHPNLAAVYEVLDLAGRPAVLLERLVGMSGSDWPALAAAPGVTFRLLNQAALALKQAHEGALIHGHLSADSFVCTAVGILKLTGLGEPLWLASGSPSADAEPSVAGDLAALGRIALGWAATASAARSGRSKGVPPVFQAVLDRLAGSEGIQTFASATELLEALDQASADLPANAAAWERFLRQVREQSIDLSLRRSA